MQIKKFIQKLMIIKMLNNFFNDFLNNKSEETKPIITSLNTQLGISSFNGFVMEIFGEPGSGKTQYIYSLISELQKENKVCCLIDAEYSFDRERALELNIELDKLILMTTNSMQRILESIQPLLKENFVDYIFIDSLAAINATNFMLQFKDLYLLCKKTNCTLIFTNQMRQKPKHKKASYGCKDVRFITDIRINMEKQKPIVVKNCMEK
jgi:RecA/RadA recombinase